MITQTSPKPIPSTPTPASTTISASNQLLHNQLAEMVQFASKRGIPLPLTLSLSNTRDEKELITNYNTMVTAIAPATLESIHYLDSTVLDPKKDKQPWYTIPIFTRCLMITGLALITLIGASLLPNVNDINQAKGLLSSSGFTLLSNLTFICAAALLGVMFYLLKTLSDKIKDYSLRPEDVYEINATILIGIISGFIISELFTFQTGILGSSVIMHKMTFALLGGFSSDGIFTLLKGIVTKLKQLLSSSVN